LITNHSIKLFYVCSSIFFPRIICLLSIPSSWYGCNCYDLLSYCSCTRITCLDPCNTPSSPILPKKPSSLPQPQEGALLVKHRGNRHTPRMIFPFLLTHNNESYTNQPLISICLQNIKQRKKRLAFDSTQHQANPSTNHAHKPTLTGSSTSALKQKKEKEEERHPPSMHVTGGSGAEHTLRMCETPMVLRSSEREALS
jgi:hypothetical protein